MTTANDLIKNITNAIIRQEGTPPDNFNPGNLRAAPWNPSAKIGGGWWWPRSRGEGIAGICHVVALHVAEGNSLEQLINIWAPPSDGNDTQQYIINVSTWAGIPDVTVPLWDCIEQEPTT